MRTFVVVAVTALMILPAGAAEITVEYEVGVDFGSYKTYAWRPGNEAGRPDAQLAIVQSVERELRVRGFKKVSEREADLFVITSAVSVGSARASGGYVYLQNYDIGVLTHDYVVKTKGFLAVDLIDSTTEKPVWRGLATEVMGLPSPAKLRKKIEKVTRKMFKDFPER